MDTADREIQRSHALLRAEAEHRLKTSLAVVTGWASTLDDDWDRIPDQTRRRAVAVIRRVSDEMAAEAASLVDQARAELLTIDADPVRVDLTAVLHVTTESFDGVSAEHAVELEPTDGSVLALVDPAALQQVLGHLIENAVKYSPPGTRVRLRAVADVERAQAVLEVEDEGPGIPDDLDLFAPFVRGPEAGAHPGAGLGLYIVQTLARSMGGEVTAHPNPERPGSTFRVHLPLAG